MISKTLINKIKGPLLAIEENLEKSVKNIDGFVDETLKWFDDMEIILDNKLKKQKRTNRKKNIQSSQLNCLNSAFDCSIATRTRAAQKAMREPQFTSMKVFVTEKATSKAGHSPNQNIDETLNSNHPAEDTLFNNSSKRIKREQQSTVEKEIFKMPCSKLVEVKNIEEPPKPAKRTKRIANEKNDDNHNITAKEADNITPKEVPKQNNTLVVSENSKILEAETNMSFDNNRTSPQLRSTSPKKCLSTKTQSVGPAVESQHHKNSGNNTHNNVDGIFNNLLPNVRCSTPKKRSSRTSLCSPANKTSPIISAISAGIVDETMSNSMLCEAKSSTPKEDFMERTYALRSSLNRKNFRAPNTIIDVNNEAVSNSIVQETKICTPKKTLDNTNVIHSSYIKPSSRTLKGSSEKKMKDESIDLNLKRPAPVSPPNEEINNQDEPRNKRTRKVRTKQKENNDHETGIATDTQRITRTKAKQSQAIQEAKIKAVNSSAIRKSLTKHKIASLHDNKLKSFESQLLNQKLQNRILAAVQRSASKNECLKVLSSKIKLPVARDILNSHFKLNNENAMSTGKGKYMKIKTEPKTIITPAKGGQFCEVVAKSSANKAKEDKLEKVMKLKALKEKEEEALIKKETALKNRQRELKEKNEMKLKSAMKQRQKLESEKYNNIVQSEKEKEAKRQMLLQERELKLKEKTLQKKILIEKKLAETEERRRLEEEARIAKLKEQEAEQRRIMLEKQKALELHEKRVQERLADQKAREKFEMKLKEEQIREKMMAAKMASKIHSASKASEQTGKKWNYQSRSEQDYGLEDENSEEDSDREDRAVKKRAIPEWAKRVLHRECPVSYHITERMMMEYMPCYSKTPDIRQMFKMTPNKKILRTSSAIWDTPNT